MRRGVVVLAFALTGCNMTCGLDVRDYPKCKHESCTVEYVPIPGIEGNPSLLPISRCKCDALDGGTK